MTKPIALEDLTKAELIQLVRDRLPFCRQADLLRAQWDASTVEWKRLEAAAQEAEAPLTELAQAVSAATTGAQQLDALDRYKRSRKAADAARAKAEREYQRGEALYARLTATDAEPRRRRA